MNEKLLEIITPSAVISYADACFKLCDKMLELQKQNYNNFIIPSRGAYPFYYYTYHVYNHFRTSFLDLHTFNTKRKVWLLPFTSDWGNADLEMTSEQSRRFWVKVLDDFLNKRSTPFTSFYRLMVDELAPRFAINTWELLPSERFLNNDSEGFVFLDTVVSGRAICEIISALKEFDVKDYYLILIIDENGKKLDANYETIINNEIANGRAEIIYVQKIFSEDASPMLNHGISSMVFPSLMEEAISTVHDFKNENFIGAGLWIGNSITHIYNTTLNAVRGTLFDLICRGIRFKLTNGPIYFNESILDDVSQMIQYAGNFNLFDQDYTRRIVSRRIQKEVGLVDQITASSSHVLRTELKNDCLSSLKAKYRYY
ncbi:hypothetical protein [Nubsella zeaxanthinifaciens]|uniref:hypothetical protein n=1 Tax=Nubsella zeaxanthinifaciens TaxID=392412 RepID=UPI000DE44A3D|nr:hypothetical protein [Nubsella zeaxanthinifaciens]